MTDAEAVTTDFSSATLVDITIDGADIQKSSFAGASIERASGRNANLRECIFEEAAIVAGRFDGAQFHYSDFSNARFDRVSFQGADFTHSNLHSVAESEVVWAGARLSGARRTDQARAQAESYAPPQEEAAPPDPT
jgi:uncharacterized protein YjbI with pentapeptide repeats